MAFKIARSKLTQHQRSDASSNSRCFVSAIPLHEEEAVTHCHPMNCVVLPDLTSVAAPFRNLEIEWRQGKKTLSRAEPTNSRPNSKQPAKARQGLVLFSNSCHLNSSTDNFPSRESTHSAPRTLSEYSSAGDPAHSRPGSPRAARGTTITCAPRNTYATWPTAAARGSIARTRPATSRKPTLKSPKNCATNIRSATTRQIRRATGPTAGFGCEWSGRTWSYERAKDIAWRASRRPLTRQRRARKGRRRRNIRSL